jgi:LmbE family N-acetylglucosaminyl deacetylase
MPVDVDAAPDRPRLGALLGGSADLAVVVVAAHPDDETLGASSLLARFPSAVVVHLTDGAPRDPRFRSPAAPASRAEYAQLRHQEALAALAHVGIGADRVIRLGAADQDAVLALVELTERLELALAWIRPGLVVTHPYEGGHPDHDAAAFVTQLAVQRLRDVGGPRVARVEMASYHGLGGRLVTGAFLPTSGRPEAPDDLAVLALSPDERERKRRMLACFGSQRAEVGKFAVADEPFRRAPGYDFRAPPHPGPLWYEQLGWPLTGARWRELAGGALDRLGPGCRSRS